MQKLFVVLPTLVLVAACTGADSVKPASTRTLACLGPSADLGENVPGRDHYGIAVFAVARGQTVRQCRSLPAVSISAASCLVNPVEGANGWRCQSGVSCADGIVFSEVTLTLTTGTPAGDVLEECVSVQNGSARQRHVQIHVSN